MLVQKTKTETRIYRLGDINIESQCNAIAFYNVGIAGLWINQYYIAPGTYLSISQDFNKLDDTKYTLTFKRSSFYDSIPNSYLCSVIKTYNEK